MTPEEARKQLYEIAHNVSPFSDLHRESPLIVDALLADVPLLMQAIGAEPDRGINKRGFFQRRWVTEWQEWTG